MKRLLLFSALLLLLPFQGLAQVTEDPDGDNLTSTEEDANGNGTLDEGETDPMNADTDRGGEADGAELREGRNPRDARDDFTYDLDGDGLSNGQELSGGTDPENTDTDGDGLSDSSDPFPLQKSYTSDTDRDGMTDEYEESMGFDPEKRSDAEEDPDEDGVTNVEEFELGIDPLEEDTDGDGIPDGEEIAGESDPRENPCLFYAGPGEPLHDIGEHWGKTFITLLHEITIGESGPRIVDGFSTDLGRMFRPDQQISRFELLKIILLGNCITIPETVDERTGLSFTDIPRAARPRETADRPLRRRIIYAAVDLGIIEGYPDGTFRPDAPINRAEALKILFLASLLEPFDLESRAGRFTDVPLDAWFTPYVEDALSYDFLEGFPDSTFRPSEFITRAEAAKLVLSVMMVNPRINGYVIPTEDLE